MKKVLQVGNCTWDSPRLKEKLETLFDVKVESANSIEEAINLNLKEKFDLIITNRILDITREEGLELIDKVKDKTKIMMLTNYPEKQEEATEHGAVGGFGKQDLFKEDTEEIIKILSNYL